MYVALRELKMIKCPKCAYERRAEDRGDAGICPACGLVFAKWVSRTLGTAQLRRQEANAGSDEGGSCLAGLIEQLTFVEPRTDTMLFRGRVALFAVFVVWGLYFVTLDLRSNDIGASFMHRVNLVFHEAGHVIFMPFGQFMHILGGSLGQLLMPAIVLGVMVFKNHDNFGGSICLWWIGQSLKDLAPYINDARDLQLQLLTGNSQDVPEHTARSWFDFSREENRTRRRYHRQPDHAAGAGLGRVFIIEAISQSRSRVTGRRWQII